jgi:radical SAM superfamily enzyme YgiQ (UPF0313 family)
MKILFSNPPWWPRPGFCGVRAGSRWPHTYQSAGNAPGVYRFGEYLPFPHFMAYAASYCRREFPGAEVVFRDSIALRESDADYFLFLQDQCFDFVVIETSTPSFRDDIDFLSDLDDGIETKIIICGAGHAGRVLINDSVCAVVRGEYEKGVCRVIRGERGVIEHDLLTLAEMNAAPIPDFPAETWDHYCDHQPAGQLFPHLQIWTSRGCPYKCIFCVWPATMTNHDPDGTGVRKVRQYGPEYVDAYLREMTALHPFKSIYIDDDTFNLGDRHTLAMCTVLGRIGLPWSAMCRADTISPYVWAEMKKAGCFGVKIGFESGSQQVIDTIVNKRLNLEEAAVTIARLRELGMTTHGTFTVGLPGETASQRDETMRYIHRLYALGMTTHQISGTAEIEGTPLATLRDRGHLGAYSGATLDGYTTGADGAQKLRNEQ